MSDLQSVTIRHPKPYDIVNNPVSVCGIGTAFEGRFAARLRDAGGAQLQQTLIEVGGMGVWNEFHIELNCSTTPPTSQGTVEIFALSPRDGSEMNTIVVPVIFGSTLIEPYRGFAQYSVKRGDNLASIAKQFYEDDGLWQRVLEANRHQLINPDRVYVGQVLRIPQ